MVGWTLAESDLDQDSQGKQPTSVRKPLARSPEKPSTGTRNYYEELFRKSEPAAKANAATSKSASVREPNAANRTERKPIPTRPLRQSIAQQKSDDAADVAKQPSEKSTSAVINAKLDDASKAPNKVQQVLIQTRPRTSRIPVPPKSTSNRTSAAARTSLDASVFEAHAATGPLSSAITLEWVKKSEFNLGQECTTELVVKNTGTSVVENVVVDAVFQTPVRVTSATPQPSEARDRLSWTFGSLAAGAEEHISVKLIPSRRGDLGLVAQVRLSGAASAKFRVEEPLLNVELKGPEEVMLGEGATLMVVISNPGTGAAHDVKISAQAAGGLELARADGKTLETDIGTILPGESRNIRLPLVGVKGGKQSVSVTASGSANVSQAATTAIHVVSPSLAVAADGPALRYKGRNAKFTVNVTNDGTVANNNVRVVQNVAEGFQFVSADRGGKYDPDVRTVSWFLGRMESDQSVELSCELEAVQLGEFTQKITAASDAGARAETALDTKVDGAPALTIELVDLDDPVETGVETGYEIRIKNAGSKAATGVALKCELSDGVQLLSAKGPTNAAAERQMVTFKPLPQLAPGEEAVFRVQVKGLRDGNARIKALVSSDSLTEPLVQEEQTKFYSDGRAE
jgi:uncharacterized repeat protein (TIGR01451 family)